VYVWLLRAQAFIQMRAPYVASLHLQHLQQLQSALDSSAREHTLQLSTELDNCLDEHVLSFRAKSDFELALQCARATIMSVSMGMVSQLTLLHTRPFHPPVVDEARLSVAQLCTCARTAQHEGCVLYREGFVRSALHRFLAELRFLRAVQKMCQVPCSAVLRQWVASSIPSVYVNIAGCCMRRRRDWDAALEWLARASEAQAQCPSTSLSALILVRRCLVLKELHK
jgi:hypothetical protein